MLNANTMWRAVQGVILFINSVCTDSCRSGQLPLTYIFYISLKVLIMAHCHNSKFCCNLSSQLPFLLIILYFRPECYILYFRPECYMRTLLSPTINIPVHCNILTCKLGAMLVHRRCCMPWAIPIWRYIFHIYFILKLLNNLLNIIRV
jgi:hypothetical protein